ncbi:MAG: hypothetical protein IPI60_10675 [Saprospiraceae bacterium]|nr:hypothetical protein [Saprospiraceae bacterium]
MKQYPLLLALVLISILSSCKKETLLSPNTTQQYSAQQLVSWTGVINNVIRNAEGHVTPIAARDWAFISIAAYEAGVPGMPEKRSLSGQIEGLQVPVTDNNKTYHWGIAVNSAIAETAIQMFQNVPAQTLESIIQMENEHFNQFSGETDAATASRSRQYGRDVAAAVIALESQDAIAHQRYVNIYDANYVSPVGEAYWKPAAPAFQAAILPDWHNVNTLASRKSSITPLDPNAYSTETGSSYYQEANEVASFFGQLSDDQLHMAEFWNDASPGQTMGTAGRWMAINTQILENTNANLSSGLESMVKVGLALHDAAIVCWQSKYRFNAKTPADYIREHINPAFTAKLNSLSGPEYTTEHAVLAGAAAEVLENTFGKEFAFTDRCHENRSDFNGTPRNFQSFHQAAKESALSRMYAGSNYRKSCLEGHKIGTETGKQVLSHIKWRY